MSALVAVQGCTVSVLPPVAGGSVTIQTPASTKCKAEGKGIYSGDISVLVAGTSLGALTQVDPATITISPSIVKKNKADGKIMLAVGDKGQTSSPVTFSAGQTSSTSVIMIQITDAGQSKVVVE
nr:MAG TPA: hypothetical protein [Bacteriophage sp.]